MTNPEAVLKYIIFLKYFKYRYINTRNQNSLHFVHFSCHTSNCSKKMSQTCVRFLTGLFQVFFDKGIFTDSQKVARAQPVFEKDLRLYPQVMKSVINSKILKHLRDSQDRQDEFRLKRSITDLLNFVTHSWNNSLIFHGESQIITSVIHPLQ